MPAREESFRLDIGKGEEVGALFTAAADPAALYILAHGAGTGMDHPGMAWVAAGLAGRGISTLRYQFRYRERGEKRPDPPPVAHRVVRSAIAEARRRSPNLPLFAGGRSFGGRMTSQAEALEPTGVTGLVFLGFPLHPAGKPGIERAAHLAEVRVPMLFIQGARDALAESSLIREVTGDLGRRAKLHLVEAADHSFRVPARSGRREPEVRSEIIDSAADWMLQPRK
jgi:predicted alpha/beta-hydrolase family hydrolase